MLLARRIFHQAVAPSFPSFLFQPFLVRSGRRRLLASAKSGKMKLNSVDGRGLLPIRRLGPTGLAKVAQSPTVGPVRFVANLGDALFERDVLFHSSLTSVSQPSARRSPRGGDQRAIWVPLGTK